MSFNEKKYIKTCNSICKQFPSSIRKECAQVNNCRYEKCKQQVINTENALITDEERKKCGNNMNTKSNINNNVKCISNLMKLKKYEEHYANLEHCKANKCPEDYKMITKLNKYISENMDKKYAKKFKILNKCRDNYCKTELDKRNKFDSYTLENECYKKYNNFKDQHKCFNIIANKKNALSKPYRKCIETHCRHKSNSKSKSKSKSKTKKIHK